MAICLKSPNASGLADALLRNPYLTVAQAAQALNVSIPTATKTVNQLAATGQLREITGRTWGKTYLAPAILEAIDLAKSGI